jgi:hypothetical protein
MQQQDGLDLPVLHLLRLDERQGKNTYELVQGRWGNQYGYPDSVYIDQSEWDGLLHVPARRHLRGYDPYGQASNHRPAEWREFCAYVDGMARRLRKAHTLELLEMECPDMCSWDLEKVAAHHGGNHLLADSLLSLTDWVRRAVKRSGSVSVVSL